jgi:hypothetical protein
MQNVHNIPAESHTLKSLHEKVDYLTVTAELILAHLTNPTEEAAPTPTEAEPKVRAPRRETWSPRQLKVLAVLSAAEGPLHYRVIHDRLGVDADLTPIEVRNTANNLVVKGHAYRVPNPRADAMWVDGTYSAKPIK